MTPCGPSSHSFIILLYIFYPLWLQWCVHTFFWASPLFTQLHLIRSIFSFYFISSACSSHHPLPHLVLHLPHPLPLFPQPEVCSSWQSTLDPTLPLFPTLCHGGRTAPGLWMTQRRRNERNRAWAFLSKCSIKACAVHNELTLIQLRCTSCLSAISHSFSLLSLNIMLSFHYISFHYMCHRSWCPKLISLIPVLKAYTKSQDAISQDAIFYIKHLN